ncbi:hypothetical protein [Histidinibacterium aquaticum]|uniref:Uncharacterized protein n=1 Tax=Histidinibacterium aquaticum TaxID=2613962 RepID=A0A5J5GBW3_9RHOB|nr:hypothetical protein [Histidinibacterium aquaticum]KAA9005636.1 hypothetical protein F3S47_17175 [Histidinibacterium aquaticum]
MEISLRPAQVAPSFVADARPTADTAALVRDPQPDLPLPLPPGQGQHAATLRASLVVTTPEEARGTEGARRHSAIDPMQRTLKPYGVTMLPDEAARRAAAEQAQAVSRAASDAAATEARAEDESRRADDAKPMPTGQRPIS